MAGSLCGVYLVTNHVGVEELSVYHDSVSGSTAMKKSLSNLYYIILIPVALHR